MLFRHQKLNRLMLGAVVATIAIPLLNIFFIFPHFKQLQVSNIENAAIRLAQHMETELHEIGSWVPLINGQTLSPAGDKLLSSYMADFQLQKIKVFTRKGLTVYSSAPEDIGTLNENDYFQNKVANGESYSKIVKKDTKSLENQIYQADVVEVYVPSMQNGQFTGAFELYYNVTKSLNALENAIYYSSLVPLLLAGFLLFSLFWGILNLDRSLLAKERAEEEVKTLQGIIPICMHCKEIRDDEGDWNRLEKYITEHSEAQFSHGICDKCVAEHYENELEELEKLKL